MLRLLCFAINKNGSVMAIIKSIAKRILALLTTRWPRASLRSFLRPWAPLSEGIMPWFEEPSGSRGRRLLQILRIQHHIALFPAKYAAGRVFFFL